MQCRNEDLTTPLNIPSQLVTTQLVLPFSNVLSLHYLKSAFSEVITYYALFSSFRHFFICDFEISNFKLSKLNLIICLLIDTRNNSYFKELLYTQSKVKFTIIYKNHIVIDSTLVNQTLHVSIKLFCSIHQLSVQSLYTLYQLVINLISNNSLILDTFLFTIYYPLKKDKLEDTTVDIDVANCFVFHSKGRCFSSNYRLKNDLTEVLDFINEVLLVVRILANNVVFYVSQSSVMVLLIVTKCDKH